MLDSMFDASWVELTFLDAIENFFMYSRFMSRIDFPGLWFMPKFLINVYNVCQTPETCIKSCKCAQTLISEDQYAMKWAEPEFENQNTQRRRIGDSCVVIYFVGNE